MFFTYRLAKNKLKYLKYCWGLYPLGLRPITIVERRRNINNVKKKKRKMKRLTSWGSKQNRYPGFTRTFLITGIDLALMFFFPTHNMAFLHILYSSFTSWLDADARTCSCSSCLSVRPVRFVYTISTVPCLLTSVVCFGWAMDPNMKLLCDEVGGGQTWLSWCEFSLSFTLRWGWGNFFTLYEWGCKGVASVMPKLLIGNNNSEVRAPAGSNNDCSKLFWLGVAEVLFWANNGVSKDPK